MVDVSNPNPNANQSIDPSIYTDPAGVAGVSSPNETANTASTPPVIAEVSDAGAGQAVAGMSHDSYGHHLNMASGWIEDLGSKAALRRLEAYVETNPAQAQHALTAFQDAHNAHTAEITADPADVAAIEEAGDLSARFDRALTDLSHAIQTGKNDKAVSHFTKLVDYTRNTIKEAKAHGQDARASLLQGTLDQALSKANQPLDEELTGTRDSWSGIHRTGTRVSEGRRSHAATELAGILVDLGEVDPKAVGLVEEIDRDGKKAWGSLHDDGTALTGALAAKVKELKADIPDADTGNADLTPTFTRGLAFALEKRKLSHPQVLSGGAAGAGLALAAGVDMAGQAVGERLGGIDSTRADLSIDPFANPDASADEIRGLLTQRQAAEAKFNGIGNTVAATVTTYVKERSVTGMAIDAATGVVETARTIVEGGEEGSRAFGAVGFSALTGGAGLASRGSQTLAKVTGAARSAARTAKSQGIKAAVIAGGRSGVALARSLKSQGVQSLTALSEGGQRRVIAIVEKTNAAGKKVKHAFKVAVDTDTWARGTRAVQTHVGQALKKAAGNLDPRHVTDEIARISEGVIQRLGLRDGLGPQTAAAAAGRAPSPARASVPNARPDVSDVAGPQSMEMSGLGDRLGRLFGGRNRGGRTSPSTARRAAAPTNRPSDNFVLPEHMRNASGKTQDVLRQYNANLNGAQRGNPPAALKAALEAQGIQNTDRIVSAINSQVRTIDGPEDFAKAVDTAINHHNPSSSAPRARPGRTAPNASRPAPASFSSAPPPTSGRAPAPSSQPITGRRGSYGAGPSSAPTPQGGFRAPASGATQSPPAAHYRPTSPRPARTPAQGSGTFDAAPKPQQGTYRAPSFNGRNPNLNTRARTVGQTLGRLIDTVPLTPKAASQLANKFNRRLDEIVKRGQSPHNMTPAAQAAEASGLSELQTLKQGLEAVISRSGQGADSINQAILNLRI